MNDSGYNWCNRSSCYRPYFGYDCYEPTYLPEWNQTMMDELLLEGCNCTSLMQDNNIKNLVCAPYAVEHAWYIQCVYFFMFGTIIAMSIGGNLVVIWIVLAHKRMRTVTNYFLVNLAIADTSISLFNVCFSFTFNLYYDWVFGKSYCIFNNFMGVVPTCASVFTLMSMSLDRFFAVVYPLKRRLSQKKTLAIILYIWIAACLCGLPMLLYSHTLTFFFETGYENTVCLSDKYPDGTADTSVQFRVYNYFLLFISYLLPLAVLTVTYTRMGMELWGNQSIGDHRHELNIKAKKKVVKMMIVVVAIFMTCWLPYHLYFTIFIKRFAEDLDMASAIHMFLNMYWLAMSSTVANPIIYMWLNSKFRIGFKYVFRWVPCVKMTKDEYYNSELRRDKLLESTAGGYVLSRQGTLRNSKRDSRRTNFRNGGMSPSNNVPSKNPACNRKLPGGSRARTVSVGTYLTSIDEESSSQAMCLINNQSSSDCPTPVIGDGDVAI